MNLSADTVFVAAMLVAFVVLGPWLGRRELARCRLPSRSTR